MATNWRDVAVAVAAISGIACSTQPYRSDDCNETALYYQYDSSSDASYGPRSKQEFLDGKNVHAVDDPELVSLFIEACKGQTKEIDRHVGAYGRVFSKRTSRSAWIVDDNEVAFDEFKSQVRKENIQRAIELLEGEP